MFSTAQLKLIRLVARGTTQPNKLAEQLKKDISQIYHLIRKLKEKNILEQKSTIQLTKYVHVQKLAQLLAKEQTIISRLAGSGIEIYSAICDTTKTAKEIAQHTNKDINTVYYKLKQAIQINLIQKEQHTYTINAKLWNEAYEFLKSYQEYIHTTDNRIPIGATIYYKTEKEIVFSYKGEVDATKTAFSRFSELGITIQPQTNTYYLPKKQLDINSIFTHATYITEKEMSAQQIILLALFYTKYQKEIRTQQDKITTLIQNILNGEHIQGMPTREEIQTRAELYGIQLTQ